MELLITKDIVLQRLKKTLSAAQQKRSSVYWLPELIPKDTPVNTGMLSAPAPFDCILVFVDLAPNLNWAHPCLYLLLGKQNEQVEKIESSFPPSHFYDVNSCFLLMKAGEVIDSDNI